MVRTDDWRQLVERLDAWSAASELAPGRIEVTVPHPAGVRRAVVVMTADEWDDMAGVMWGDVERALDEVKRTLLALRSHEGFAVYRQYQLHPAVEDVLPESRVPRPEPRLYS